MILDTNAVSAGLSGDETVGALLADEERHHLPVIAIGEYRYGLQRSSSRRRLEPLLDALVRESRVLPVDEETAEAYAGIREALRAAGTPIPENDVWISALARQHDLAIVSRDAHFDRVKGVHRIGW